MRRIFYLTVMILALAASTVNTANIGKKRFSPENVSRLDRITGYLYNDDFETAAHSIDSLEESDGLTPLRHFFRAVLYQARMMADESDDYREVFFAVLDSLENDAALLLARGDDSTLAYCYLGHACAFRSLYYGRNGSIWKALKSGLGARKAYISGYEIDPTFHDIALGLGSYRYWKSVKTKAINWTPLFKDERQEGIELIRLAADSSEISTEAAAVSLIWIYINEKLYAEAIRLADAMHGRYPNGLTFLWALGEIYYKMSDWPTAIRYYEDILDRLRQNPGNHFNIIEASYYLSDCYRKTGDQMPEYCVRLARLQTEVRSLPLPEKTRKRQNKKIKKILQDYRCNSN